MTYPERKQQQKDAGHGAFVAAIAHILRDKHADPAGYDQWYLSIVLVTTLSYLYVRSWSVLLFGFVVWYMFENLVWYSIGLFSQGIRNNLRCTESRERELLIDPAVFLMTLAASMYTFEISFVAQGAGASFDAALSTEQWLQAVVISILASWAGFMRGFWLTLLALLAAIWIIFALDSSNALQLWIALRASAVALFYFAWFIRPIAMHFLYNALFAVFYMLCAVAIVDTAQTLRSLSFWVAILSGSALAVISLFAFNHAQASKVRVRIRRLEHKNHVFPSSEALASQFLKDTGFSPLRGFRSANFFFSVLPAAYASYQPE